MRNSPRKFGRVSRGSVGDFFNSAKRKEIVTRHQLPVPDFDGENPGSRHAPVERCPKQGKDLHSKSENISQPGKVKMRF